MNNLLFYGFIALISVAIPLRIHHHKFIPILAACIGEAFCMGLLYASTFIMCSDQNNCGASWAGSAIPLLFIAMNIGMIWPILAGYARQAKKDEEAKNENENESL